MTTTAHAYAISHWPDTDELLAKAKRLVAAPPRPIRRDRMQEYLQYFETKCRGSKASTAKAAKFIPGGVQHNLAFNYPFPINIARAAGAYLWDVDGNRYIDFLQAGGPTVLGSNYGPLREKVIQLLNECGPVTATQLTSTLKHRPGSRRTSRSKKPTFDHPWRQCPARFPVAIC